MKKVMIVLTVVSLFASAVPVYAMDHTGTHNPADVQCAKDCELLLKNCSQEVESIQLRIKKLKADIKKNGADQKKLETIKALKLKLDDANAMLRSLEVGDGYAR